MARWGPWAREGRRLEGVYGSMGVDGYRGKTVSGVDGLRGVDGYRW